ncbi:GGDEF domain-containing protein [Zobellella iuensis]|uniref:diguanylate cyclase n=1 Tax=Zobellella iuensis TaxID=2803811 RepID=A0ABS1QNS7_9GAMM|nr:GGDEF domain-containing protein [Zobellella iuensis]MBL1376512.1 diguanylate cyclase [Zobellella iuensis]
MSRSQGFHPSLSTTLSLVVCALLLFMAVITWLVVPLLSGISHGSGQTREQHMPEILNNQRHALKIEKISSYLNTVYWAQNSNMERRARLQAQVLIQSFMLEDQSSLSAATADALDNIKQLINIRNQQREHMGQVHGLLHRLAVSEAPEQSASSARLAQALHSFNTELASGSLTDIRWPRLEVALDKLRQQLPDTEGSAQHWQWLDKLSLRLQEVSALNERADEQLATGQQQLQQIANYLTTDAALRIQQLAGDISRDAQAVTRYTYLLIGVVTLISLMLFGALQHFILKPLQASVQALRAIEQDQDDHVRLPPVLFSELATICRAVEDYSAMTRKLWQANDELHQLSQQDGLTGLANRRHFDQALREALNRVRRHNGTLALLMLDIDHFKQLNDGFGHLHGDECLKALARILKGYGQRSGELAARYGGEEFALILTDLNRQQLTRLCEHIRQEVARLLLPQAEPGPPMRFTVSIGAALLPAAELGQETELLMLADKALYQAKQDGRNRVVIGERELPRFEEPRSALG